MTVTASLLLSGCTAKNTDERAAYFRGCVYALEKVNKYDDEKGFECLRHSMQYDNCRIDSSHPELCN